MGKHPLNLALRFALELISLTGVGFWCWQLGNVPWLSTLYLLGGLILFMALWVTFNVPGDPSRSGKAPIPVRGWHRLVLELILLFAGSWAFYDLGYERIALAYAGLLILHYALSVDRIKWLLER